MSINRNRILPLGTKNASNTDFLQVGTVTASATSGTVVVFPVAFSAAPVITASAQSAGTFGISVTTVSAGSFTLTSAAAGTITWHAVNPQTQTN